MTCLCYCNAMNHQKLLSICAAITMIFNMYHNNGYLVSLSCNTIFMMVGINIWNPFEYKLWAILFTIGTFLTT